MRTDRDGVWEVKRRRYTFDARIERGSPVYCGRTGKGVEDQSEEWSGGGGREASESEFRGVIVNWEEGVKFKYFGLISADGVMGEEAFRRSYEGIK